MYGLILEGGGAKGAYHVGAYKALIELGIEIGGVAGTSIGALNGAAIVQGDISKLENLWLESNVNTLFGMNEDEIIKLKNFDLAQVNVSYMLSLSKDIIYNKGIDTTKMRSIINDYLDEDKIRASELDFGLVTVSLSDRKPLELLKEEVPVGKLNDYIFASAYLPAFKMEKIDGKMFLDGGYYNNLPVSVLARKGYKDFIAVRTNAIGIVKKIRRTDLKITYIEPIEDLGSMLDFNKDNAVKNLKLGYFDTLKVFNKLKGYKYYCIPYNGNFSKFLIDMFHDKKEVVKRIGKMMGFENIPVDRMIFEKILPRLETVLELSGNSDYQDIVLKIVEYVAEKYDEIERFKIYDAEEFMRLTVRTFRNKPIIPTRTLPDFLKKNRIFSIAAKDELILDVFRELIIGMVE